MSWINRKIREDLIGILMGIVIAFFIVTYMLSNLNVLTVTDNPKAPIQVVNGEAFTYCRTVSYERDAVIKLDKSLIKHIPTGEIIVLSYPSHTFTRKAGFNQKICKTMKLPEYLDDGLWVMETYVSYTAFPFWRKTIKLKNIVLAVRTEEEK